MGLLGRAPGKVARAKVALLQEPAPKVAKVVPAKAQPKEAKEKEAQAKVQRVSRARVARASAKVLLRRILLAARLGVRLQREGSLISVSVYSFFFH